MLGAIIGDIAGSRFEFNNTKDYDFDMFGEGHDYTDDTICSIAVADAVLNNKDYQEAMREWCRKYPNPMGAYGSYFLNWIFSSDPHPYNSYGNGSAMRVSPISWLFDSEEIIRKEAKASAAITHNHPEGIKGAVAIAIAIFRMRKAENKSKDIFVNVAKEFYGENPFESLPEKGYFDVTCQGCVPLSLYITSIAENFEDAIRKAISYGGDTDTVGAIVGSLAEAHFGLPADMVKQAKAFLPDDMLRILSQFEKQKSLHNTPPDALP